MALEMTEKPCPKCGLTNWVMVEYSYGSPQRYDGVSELNCRECGARFGRWTGKELKDNYIEPRWGGNGEPVKS